MRRKMSVLAFVMCASVIIFTGCVNLQRGNPIKGDQVSRIEKGKTTRADLEAWFGPPMAVNMVGNGERIATWHCAKTKLLVGVPFLPGIKTGGEMVTLQARLSADGVVRDFEYNGSVAREKIDLLHGEVSSASAALVVTNVATNK